MITLNICIKLVTDDGSWIVFFSSAWSIPSVILNRINANCKAFATTFLSMCSTCTRIFRFKFNLWNTENSVRCLKPMFTIWIPLSALKTDKICRHFRRDINIFLLNGNVVRITSDNVQCTACRLRRCIIIISSDTNSDVLHSSLVIAGFTSIERVFWWCTGIGTLKVECAVRPPSESWTAAAEESKVSILSPFDLIYRFYGEVTIVFPVSLRTSEKNERCIFSHKGGEYASELALKTTRTNDRAILINKSCCSLLNFEMVFSDFRGSSAGPSCRARSSKAGRFASSNGSPKCPFWIKLKRQRITQCLHGHTEGSAVHHEDPDDFGIIVKIGNEHIFVIRK